MDILEIADWLHVPVFSAFLLGIMASIGPCPMASNVAALAYISRKISDRRYVITGSILYTLGRMITYTVLGMLIIYAGLNIPAIADFLKEFGVVAMGPLLITVGIIMLFIDRIEFGEGEHQFGDAAGKFADMGLLGALPLGMVLALAFCPYSAVLFFMVMIPLALQTQGGVGLPAAFALGTGLPVIAFGALLSLGVTIASRWLNAIGRAERYIRTAMSVIFIVIGIICIIAWAKNRIAG